MSKKQLLFVDFTCPKPYSPETLKTEGLGGTEATVVRVAEALSEWYDVYVLQHNRNEMEKYNAQYFGLNNNLEVNPTIVVILRDALALPSFRDNYPHAQLYIWLHDLMNPPQAVLHPIITETKTQPIFVSQWHKESSKEVLKSIGWKGEFKLDFIYNPVEDYLVKDNTEVDKYKLIFTSSPHKGLEYTLKVFKNLHNIEPKYTLYVLNPGYVETPLIEQDGVRVLGKLPHHKVIEEVRSSLCLFHLNYRFPETQGIVYTEAQAVGTPFISHQLGAMIENSDHPSQIIDVKNPKEVIETVFKWTNGERPIVRCKQDFRLSNVIKKWLKILKG